MMTYVMTALTKIATLLISKKFWGTIIPMFVFFTQHSGSWTPTDIQIIFAPLLVFVVGEFGLDYARIKTDFPVVENIEAMIEAKVSSMLQSHATNVAAEVTKAIIALPVTTPKVVVELEDGHKLVKPADQQTPADKLADPLTR